MLSPFGFVLHIHTYTMYPSRESEKIPNAWRNVIVVIFRNSYQCANQWWACMVDSLSIDSIMQLRIHKKFTAAGFDPKNCHMTQRSRGPRGCDHHMHALLDVSLLQGVDFAAFHPIRFSGQNRTVTCSKLVVSCEIGRWELRYCAVDPGIEGCNFLIWKPARPRYMLTIPVRIRQAVICAGFMDSESLQSSQYDSLTQLLNYM